VRRPGVDQAGGYKRLTDILCYLYASVRHKTLVLGNNSQLKAVIAERPNANGRSCEKWHREFLP
jgi:hypothetical protein